MNNQKDNSNEIDKKENQNINNDDDKNYFDSLYLSLINLINRYHYDDDSLNKFYQSFNSYIRIYKDKINCHIDNPESSKEGLINLLNDCYIISFLQILFHTPNFLNILKDLNNKKEEGIIKHLILVSEYPFNAKYFYNLKKLLEIINPEYSNPYSNDSQEFGIDLINFLILEYKGQINELNDEILYYQEKDIFNAKKLALERYTSTYQNKINEIEKLFLFNQIDIFYKLNNIKPQIFSNLHMELTLQKGKSYIHINELIDNKYNIEVNDYNPNNIYIKSKLISLPKILIISINRALNNERINDAKIIFEDILDLKNNIDYDLFNENDKKTTYNLYAFNECIHAKKYSHNICNIKINNKWFLFDDNIKAVEKHYNSNIISNSIVGLFYIRDE